jgi:MraZ protein
MFRGRYDHTIDSKGRLSVPSKFREALLGKEDDRIIITNFSLAGMRCLEVYPMDEWLRLEAEMRTKPRFDPDMVAFQNYYIGSACECVVDKQGRILIPPALRQYANLKRDAVFVGALEKFRLWDRETWEKSSLHAEDKFAQEDFLRRLGF